VKVELIISKGEHVKSYLANKAPVQLLFIPSNGSITAQNAIEELLDALLHPHPAVTSSQAVRSFLLGGMHFDTLAILQQHLKARHDDTMRQTKLGIRFSFNAGKHIAHSDCTHVNVCLGTIAFLGVQSVRRKHDQSIADYVIAPVDCLFVLAYTVMFYCLTSTSGLDHAHADSYTERSY
jgi:hypothetical protein